MLARNQSIGSATVDLSPLLSSHEVPLVRVRVRVRVRVS
jgi:hypothetical protein